MGDLKYQSESKHLGVSYLRPGHNSMPCDMKISCDLASCSKYHIRLLYQENDKSNTNDSANSVHADNNSDNCVVLISEYINDPKSHCKITAFINDGSKVSLMDERIAIMLLYVALLNYALNELELLPAHNPGKYNSLRVTACDIVYACQHVLSD
uniref:Uncharacterized protein n=1 Tax=Glossina pallidipes TaxID=7398 RepID=A0A1A9ZWV0_GLOPL